MSPACPLRQKYWLLKTPAQMPLRPSCARPCPPCQNCACWS